MIDEGSRTRDLMSGKAMFRLGLVLVILAAAMFFRYSIEQGWVAPPVRVVMAGLAGVAMIVIGGQMSARRPAYGTLLQGGGSAVLYLAVFAADQSYGLIDRGAAFLGLAAVSTLVVSLALRRSSQALAVVGVLGALAAPLVIGGRLIGSGGDAIYIGVVVAVGVALFVRREWGMLYVAAAAGGSLAVLTESVRFALDRWTTVAVLDPAGPIELTLDALVLLVGLWLAPTVGAFRRSSRIVEVGATAGTLFAPVLATAVVLTAWQDSTSRLVSMATVLAVGGATGVVGSVIRRRRPLLAEAHLVPSLLLPLLGWFIGIERPTLLLVVVVAQGAAMTIAGARLGKLPLAIAGGGLMALSMTVWLGMVVASADSHFDATDAALGAVLVLVAYTGLSLLRTDDLFRAGSVVLWLTGGGLVGWSHAALNGLDNGPGLVTAVWASLGAVLVAAGKIEASSVSRNAGIGLLLVAVGKLLLVDTTGVSGLVRMSLFAGMGVGLLALGYWLGDEREEEVATDGKPIESGAHTP